MKLFKHPFPWVFVFLLAGLYFTLPMLSDWVVSKPVYAKYAGKDAARITNHMQSAFVYPFQGLAKGQLRDWLVIPYLLLLGFGILTLWQRFPRFWKGLAWNLLGLWTFLWFFPNTLLWLENGNTSQSTGTVSNGSIQNSKRIPFQGDNFTTNSFAGYMAGRTYVHERVRQTLLDAFEKMEKECPEITFVVGETGHKNGGHFPPHRTHRNGLSVDIMTPLLKKGKPTRSHHVFNLWGYAIEFDNRGKTERLEIDYETFALLLDVLQQVAPENGLRIQKVIFDPILRPHLLKTKAGRRIQNLPFTKNRVIIRHDDHVHIDFAVF